MKPSLEKILVVKGGTSAEREVSLSTAQAVERALDQCGYHWQAYDFQGDFTSLIEALRGNTVIFNALHGTMGEDGRMQAIGDFLKIPYTHSGVAASAVAMHKQLACNIFQANDLPIAKHCVLNAQQMALLEDWPIPRPLVSKPIADGSSCGVELFLQSRFSEHRQALIQQAKAQPLMFEEYIPGQELTVSVVEIDGVPKALAVTELIVKDGFYDYRAKYSTAFGAQHFCPAEISRDLADELMKLAREAHLCLGLRGTSRSDFRYDPENSRIVLLETNTQPGMTPTSLLPEQALLCGIDFPRLIELLLLAARHDG